MCWRWRQGRTGCMLQAQTAPSGGQGQVAVGKGGGLWVGVRSLCASSCWLPPCARCTSQAARSPPLTPPSTLLPPRRAWVIGKKGELTEAACRPKAHSDRVTSLARAGTLLYSSEQAGGGVGWWWGGLGWGGGGGGGVGGSRVLTLVSKQGWGGAGGGGQGCTRLRPRQVGGPHPPVARSRSSAGAAGALAAHQCARCADALAPRPPSPPPPRSPPASYDGSVKAWDASTLEIVVDRRAAHSGQRVHCAAVGPDGLLYTGGDDQVSASARDSGEGGLREGRGRGGAPRGAAAVAAAAAKLVAISTRTPDPPTALPAPHSPHPPPSPPPSPPSQLVRRWQPSLLLPAAGPLYCHAHPVRTLAAGARGLLVSGDKGGEVAVWRV